MFTCTLGMSVVFVSVWYMHLLVCVTYTQSYTHAHFIYIHVYIYIYSTSPHVYIHLDNVCMHVFNMHVQRCAFVCVTVSTHTLICYVCKDSFVSYTHACTHVSFAYTYTYYINTQTHAQDATHPIIVSKCICVLSVKVVLK